MNHVVIVVQEDLITHEVFLKQNWYLSQIGFWWKCNCVERIVKLKLLQLYLHVQMLKELQIDILRQRPFLITPFCELVIGMVQLSLSASCHREKVVVMQLVEVIVASFW